MRKNVSICALCGCLTLAIIILNFCRSMQVLSRLTPAFSRTERTGAAAMTRQPVGSLRKIARDTLHISKPTWWLESRFHFSFADYYNPSNTHFGALRVVNDDLVQPKAGFGTHPHRDAEIFSYVVDGYLSHKDSMGNQEALPRGSVQYLSAGTGISHSEMNEKDVRTRFLQIWMNPDRRGHKPQYGSTEYSKADRHNKLLHLLGGTGQPPAWNNVQKGAGITLHQDANVFVSEADTGVVQDIELGAQRQAYLICIEGDMKVNEVVLSSRDAVEMVASSSDPFPVCLTAINEGAHFLFIEMQKE